MCLEFCAFGPEQASTFSFEWDHLTCLSKIGEVINCMKEGTRKNYYHVPIIAIYNYRKFRTINGTFLTALSSGAVYRQVCFI